ncbi:hypothetical protein ACROYT_G020593 [Oculina patagonica]
MADREVKTLQRFASKNSSAAPSIQSVTVSKRKNIVLLSNGSEFLYLVLEDSIIHTFRLPTSIIGVHFQEFDGKRQIIFAATEDGNIFAVSLPENLTKSKRLKKKCGDVNPEVPSEGSKPLQTDNDIFEELLAGTSAAVEKTVNQQPLKTMKCMTLIDAGSAVLFEHGLRTFLPIKDKMVCCRASEQGFVVSMYGPVAASSDIVTPAYAALPVFKATVEVPPVMSSVQESQRSCYWDYTPQLCCVQPGDSLSCSSSCAVVERHLFNKLFNCEASLLDSPVIVFGGIDGQIVFWPVNSFALTSTGSESLGGKQSFTPQVLYHLEQRVLAIYTANLCCQKDPSGVGSASVKNESGSSDKHNKESSGYCNALVFVGDRDKIVIASECLSQKADEVKAINFTSHTILGPVLCSCLNSNGDTLVHSTGKEIFVTKLNINGEMDATNSALVSLSTCMSTSLITLSMQVPNICTVCCVDKKNKTAGTKRQVYALTLDGKLLQFVLPELQDGESPMYSNVSPQVAGEKVKSYLREIETQSAELAKVTATIETEDSILKELNMVIHAACQLAEDATVGGKSTMPQQDMFPLCCTFTPTVVCYDSSGNSSVSLHCKVVNQGSLLLSSSWSLMVHIQGKEPWCRQVTTESHTMGRSLPLKICNPGSFFEIDIPLNKSFSLSFHIVAEVHLYCNLNSLLADLRSDPVSGHFFKKPVEDVLIPISRHVLDVLHFVRQNQIGSQVSVQSTVPGSKEELLQTLDKLGSESQHAMNKEGLLGHDGAKKAEESLQLGNFSASFLVSQDAVSFMKTAVKSNTAPLTLQATVLQFILTDSSISHQHIDSKYPGINLLTVNGSRASIHVKPAAGSTTSAESAPLEVTLHCSSIPLLCRLHEAVLTRLKPVITRETRKSQMRAHDLQKALEKLQTLQEKVMWLEDATSQRTYLRQDKVQRAHCKFKLWTFYEELRRVVLLV